MTLGSELTVDEGFHNSLFYFLRALEVAAADKKTQIQMGGGEGFVRLVSWEIQHDIVDVFPYLVKSTVEHPSLAKYLSARDVEAIEKTVELLRALPKDALAGHGSDLDHPAWEKIRAEASGLVSKLRDVKRKNNDWLKCSP